MEVLYKKTFIVYKDLKKYTVFVDTQESLSYGVYGLMTEIRDIIGNELPVMADALILPFKGHIVFDGMLSPYEMKITGALGKILVNSYRDSKSGLGVITELPPKRKNSDTAASETLEYYLERNKESNAFDDEIVGLIQQNFGLLKKYYDGIIKPNKEIYSAVYKRLGLKAGWFAILDGLILTSGHTEEEVLNKLQDFLSPDKLEQAIIFEINEA